PAADPERCKEELDRVLGLPSDQILSISAKTGEGVAQLLRAIIERIPAPGGNPDDPLRALIFDSYYDQYRGVISSIRIIDGTLRDDVKIRKMQAAENHEIEEIGVRTPDMLAVR